MIACETCEGNGYRDAENWHENEVQDCADCGGTGRWELHTLTIHIPMAPPVELSPNARRRGNVWAQREATEELRGIAKLFADQERNRRLLNGTLFLLGNTKCHVHEHVIWPKSKGVLPDPDALPTYCKAALDGIVDAGIIAGDSAKHVQSVTASQEKGTDTTGAIVITIKEAA